MNHTSNKEIFIFILLFIIGFLTVIYYLYQAAYKFDPYYRFKTAPHEVIEQPVTNP